jgi:hypothetical protein
MCSQLSAVVAFLWTSGDLERLFRERGVKIWIDDNFAGGPGVIFGGSWSKYWHKS